MTRLSVIHTLLFALHCALYYRLARVPSEYRACVHSAHMWSRRSIQFTEQPLFRMLEAPAAPVGNWSDRIPNWFYERTQRAGNEAVAARADAVAWWAAAVVAIDAIAIHCWRLSFSSCHVSSTLCNTSRVPAAVSWLRLSYDCRRHFYRRQMKTEASAVRRNQCTAAAETRKYSVRRNEMSFGGDTLWSRVTLYWTGDPVSPREEKIWVSEPPQMAAMPPLYCQITLVRVRVCFRCPRSSAACESREHFSILATLVWIIISTGHLTYGYWVNSLELIRHSSANASVRRFSVALQCPL